MLDTLIGLVVFEIESICKHLIADYNEFRCPLAGGQQRRRTNNTKMAR